MRIFVLLILVFFLSVVEAKNKNMCDVGTDNTSAVDWEYMADGMVNALVEHFWGANFKGYEKRYYFNYGSDMSEMSTNHYWVQAHAMDVLIDAYIRTGEEKFRNFFPLWWEGMPQYNFANKINPKDSWWNVFVDDMEWIALTLIRMFECTGNNEYILKARQMYDDWIWPTWGPEDEAPWFGGITWKTDVAKSKNACSNAPAALVAARLYNLFYKAGLSYNNSKIREAYLNEAIKIYMWEKNYLYDRNTGAVYDNINSKGEIKKEWVFTYNIGTFLGAAYDLYKITSDKQYLQDAIKSANYVIDKLSLNFGVLSDAKEGDGGLFHGIFFRYFVKLINEPSLDYNIRKKFYCYIKKSATIMSKYGVNLRTMLYGGIWREATGDNDKVCITSHLTGCMLMEAMCIIKPL